MDSPEHVLSRDGSIGQLLLSRISDLLAELETIADHASDVRLTDLSVW